MRRVAVDADVFVSFFIDRHAGQHAAARALIQQADDGEIVGVVPQSVVFEVAYVLQSRYNATAERIATAVRALTTFPACSSWMNARGNGCSESGPIRSPASATR